MMNKKEEEKLPPKEIRRQLQEQEATMETTTMMNDETKRVAGLRLYDIMSMLAIQMEENNTKSEYIQIKAFNSRTKKYNTITVTVEEL